jgi:putative nucleotidyltransferase with HDIG domain
MAVPSPERAEEILADYNLPDGIVVHSRGVARVAVEATRLVAAAGIPVDAQLVASAALLHDIDKTATRGSLDHGVLGSRWLTEMGHPELALPVASHPVTALLDEDRFPRGWPSVIVSVADRHVAQQFLTTDARIDDLVARHPEYAESLELARRPAQALELELAEVCGIGVPELVDHLRRAWETGG